MGICRGVPSILEDLQLVKPTVLFAVPTLHKKIYNGVHNLISSANPLPHAGQPPPRPPQLRRPNDPLLQKTPHRLRTDEVRIVDISSRVHFLRSDA